MKCKGLKRTNVVKTYFDTDTNHSVPYNNDRYCVQEVLTFSDDSTCEEGELDGCEFVAQVGAPDPKDDVLQRSINSGIVVSASSSHYLCSLISSLDNQLSTSRLANPPQM